MFVVNAFWNLLLAEKVIISNLSTKKTGGFVGSVVGMYASSVN